MKRLLLIPLLIAISGCSNNLSYKTNEGEKVLIKKETVEIKKLARGDFEAQLASKLLTQKKDKEREIKRLERRLRDIKKVNKNRTSDSMRRIFAEADLERIKDAEIKLDAAKDRFVSWLKRNESILRSLGKTLKDSPKIHANFISFTAIKTNLLGEKRILPRSKKLTCFNPSLKQKYKTAWKIKLNAKREASKIICDKYAKF
mgnify:CR=1 FL=1